MRLVPPHDIQIQFDLPQRDATSGPNGAMFRRTCFKCAYKGFSDGLQVLRADRRRHVVHVLDTKTGHMSV